MFTMNDDLSIYATRGDIVFFNVAAYEDKVMQKFRAGDVLRIKVFGKKDTENVVLQKDFPIAEECAEVAIYLDKEDTKIGEVISKPVDYWYEVVLNDDENPQTIIGYDESGAKVFKLFPEGDDIPPYVPDIEPEDIPVVDEELNLTSPRPIANKVVAKEIAQVKSSVTKLTAQEKVYSLIVPDGETDNTALLLAELEALEEGQCLVTPRGTCFLSGDFLMRSMKKGVTLDFSETIFKTDKDTCLIFKLKDATVYGLHIDGNRSRKNFDYTANKFGLEYLFKVDNGCSNVRFVNTTLVNAPYVGGMIGYGVDNIVFDGLYAENIGEHLFYQTGHIPSGSDIRNFTFRDVLIRNLGVNAGNYTHGHFVQFLKSANDLDTSNVGEFNGVTFENVVLENDPGMVANSLLGGYEFRNVVCNGVKGFQALIGQSRAENAYFHNCEVERVCYTSAIEYSKNVNAFGCTFTQKVAHVNFATSYVGCYFTNGFTSSEGENVLQDESLRFIGCKIEHRTGNTNIAHVYKDVVLHGCEVIGKTTSYASSGIIAFGAAAHTANKSVTISGCPNYASQDLHAYLFQFYGSGLLYRVCDMTATNRIFVTSARHVTLSNVFYLFGNGYYTPVLTDTDKATGAFIVNCFTGGGQQLDTN